MAALASYNVYNIVLTAPFITVAPYDTIYLTNFQGGLVTGQVQQVYHGCSACLAQDIIAYRKTEEDLRFTANGTIYNLIKDTQLQFYWKPTLVTVIPPS